MSVPHSVNDVVEERISPGTVSTATETMKGVVMGKGILMWLIGIPIPIIILLLIFWR